MWIIAVMYVLLIPCVAIYLRSKQWHNHRLETLIKALCTTIILCVGLIGAIMEPGLYAVLIVVGIACGLAGDVAINRSFTAGMLLFGIGHCVYIATMLNIAAYAAWGIAIFVVVYAVLIGLFRASRIAPGQLLIPMIVYSIVITAMLSIAATMPFADPLGGSIILIGAVLFALSDGMLAWITFTDDNKLDAVSLYCYFIGQSLFAVSIYVIGK